MVSVLSASEWSARDDGSQGMKAFVITGPREWEVKDVDPPVASPGQVVVEVERVGVCGTDVEFFAGEMPYLHDGFASYPIRIGHEWCGTISAVGDGVDPSWVGRRTTGDTMLGCGHCRRCRSGLQHVCQDRYEIGIRGGFPGALAEQRGSALRAVLGARLTSGDRLLVIGPGTIGLLVAKIARAVGAEVHVLGVTERSLAFARTLGFPGVWSADDLPALPWDAVIDASTSPYAPALAVDLVEPGKRVVYVGLAGTPSRIDTRTVALKDVTVVGILSASTGLAGTIEQYASGAVDPRPLVAATVGLHDAGAVLGGWRPAGAGDGPKIHIDPRMG